MLKCWICRRDRKELDKDFPDLKDVSTHKFYEISDPLRKIYVCGICKWFIYQIGENAIADSFEDSVMIDNKESKVKMDKVFNLKGRK